SRVVAKPCSLPSSVTVLCASWSPMSALPLQSAFAPHVNQRDDHHEEEAEHLGEAEPPERAELDRPRVDEHRFDVEDHEQDRGQVKLHAELQMAAAGALRAALDRQ